MTFTYNLETPDDITRVRWHLSDTVQPAMFSDEEINFAISEAGTYQKAVIACIDNKLAEMAMEPDFKADWLSVDAKDAFDRLTSLRAKKLKEFGLTGDSVLGNSIVSTVRRGWRPDSDQTEEPDYSA